MLPWDDPTAGLDKDPVQPASAAKIVSGSVSTRKDTASEPKKFVDWSKQPSGIGHMLHIESPKNQRFLTQTLQTTVTNPRDLYDQKGFHRIQEKKRVKFGELLVI